MSLQIKWTSAPGPGRPATAAVTAPAPAPAVRRRARTAARRVSVPPRRGNIELS